MLMQPFSPYPSDDDERPAPLFIDIASPDADTLIVIPVGEADLCTVPDLRQALSEITAGRSHVIVDLDRLSFMDASILGVLVEARLRLSATGGTLQVRCRTPHGQRMLSVTGLDGMLDYR
jgi:anti-anti-sigma factor